MIIVQWQRTYFVYNSLEFFFHYKLVETQQGQFDTNLVSSLLS